MDIGNSKSTISVAGLGYMIYGKIADSSADVDILERAKLNSWVYSFARIQATQGLTPLVENSFSIGNVTTYSGSTLCLFCCLLNEGNYIINNCYTAARANWKDYLTLGTDITKIDETVDSLKNLYKSRVANNANYYCQDSYNLADGVMKNMGGTAFNY
jgi:hypothetical protein